MVGKGRFTFDRQAFEQHLEIESKVELERQEIYVTIDMSRRTAFENHWVKLDGLIEERLTSLLRCVLGNENNWLIQERPFADWLKEVEAHIERRKNKVREQMRTACEDQFLEEMSEVGGYLDAVFGQYSRLVFLILEEASSHYQLDLKGFAIPPIWFSSLLADKRCAVTLRTQALSNLLIGDITQTKIQLEQAVETHQGMERLRERLSSWGIKPSDPLSDPCYQRTLRDWNAAKKLDHGLPSLYELEVALEQLANQRKKLAGPWNPTGTNPPYGMDEAQRQCEKEEKIREAICAFEHELEARLAFRNKDRVAALRELLLAKEMNRWLHNARKSWTGLGLPDIDLTQHPSYIAVGEAYEQVMKGKAAQTHQARA